VSDDDTVRIGPDFPDHDRQRRNAIIGTVVAVVLAVIVLGLFALRGGRDDDEAAPPLASADPSELATDPSSEASDAPSDEVEASESDGDDAAAAPATGDVTSFVDAYEAEHGDDVTTRLIDLDNDGTDDIVAAYVGQDTTNIDLAQWDGAQYVITFSDTGGAADDLSDVVVNDVNSEAGLEIVTFQSTGEQGESLSVWGPDGSGTYTRQNAEGGCWDGSNTFGIVGATIEPGVIEATCDGSPLPPEAWPTDVYRWQAGAWQYAETVKPE